jgi:hypothetical protein
LHSFLDSNERFPGQFALADMMQIRRNQNEKLSDQVKEKPGDRYADTDADGGREPPAAPVGGFDRG